MKKRFTRLGITAAFVALTVCSMAAAPRGAVQQAGHVLKKLDITNPPSYPAEFWTPAPAPGEKNGRDILSDDVSDCVSLMQDPRVAEEEWCQAIEEIWMVATATNAYFDISQTTNPALDDFKKDWLKVMRLSGCFD